MNKNEKGIKPAKTNISFNVVIESIDKLTRKVIKRETIHNTITNVGLERIAKLLGKLSSTGFDYIALGTDATTSQATDVALGAEVERELAGVSYVASYKCQFLKVFSVGSGVSHSVKEVGIFDSITPSGSVMWARVNCNNTLDADTDLSVTMTYTFAQA